MKIVYIPTTSFLDYIKCERPPTWMNCLEVDHAIYYQYGTDLNVHWRLAPRWILNILCIYLEGPWESIRFLFVLALSIEFHWIAFFYVWIFNCIPKFKLIIMLKNHVWTWLWIFYIRLIRKYMWLCIKRMQFKVLSILIVIIETWNQKLLL